VHLSGSAAGLPLSHEMSFEKTDVVALASITQTMGSQGFFVRARHQKKYEKSGESGVWRDRSESADHGNCE
jgi:hypothetical protein